MSRVSLLLQTRRYWDCHELSPFDQFPTDAVMRLHVAEKPTFPEDVIHRNDAGRLLIHVERGGRREADVTKPRGIMLRHHLERSLLDAVAPDLAIVHCI